jgi:hypothetical protein
MDLKEMNDDWPKDAPILAGLRKTNPFTVPDGYFKEMEAQVHSRIHIDGLSSEQVLKVPQSYFDSLADRIWSSVKLNELKPSANSDVLDVPDNYFEHLEGKIIAKIERPQDIAKVKRLRPFLRYAVAASLTAIVGLGLYFNNRENQNVEARISELPAEDIVDYLQLYSDVGDASAIMSSFEDGSELLDVDANLSAKEIEQYLEQSL